jgi:hypothetical protein
VALWGLAGERRNAAWKLLQGGAASWWLDCDAGAATAGEVRECSCDQATTRAPPLAEHCNGALRLGGCGGAVQGGEWQGASTGAWMPWALCWVGYQSHTCFQAPWLGEGALENWSTHWAYGAGAPPRTWSVPGGEATGGHRLAGTAPWVIHLVPPEQPWQDPDLWTCPVNPHLMYIWCNIYFIMYVLPP